jgi:hypothetical protein
MTGIPQFNFPAFDAAAQDLRDSGYEVVSPAEMDDPETRALALASPDGAPGSGSHQGHTWGDFLSRDVKLIADGGIEAIFVLPGWERSRGARLETFVGSTMVGLHVYNAEKPHLIVGLRELVRAWAGVDLMDALMDDIRAEIGAA